MIKYAPTFEDHIHRYAFAMMYAWKRDTLDAGSKEGFGAQVLSWAAKSITLADIEDKWLKQSEKNGGYWCPATFVKADFNKGFPEGTWDTIVSFEVIEHVEDPDFYIANIAKALRPGGHLVFSVPHMVANHEHKTLFDEAKIKEVIGKHLDIVEFYVQEKKYLNDKPMYKGLKCYVGVARKRNENKV